MSLLELAAALGEACSYLPWENARACSGRAMPPSWSTHVLHSPSSQSRTSFAACSLPRCCTHPGHAHCTPQQHPLSATGADALCGWIGGNTGGALYDVWAWLKDGTYAGGDETEQQVGACGTCCSLEVDRAASVRFVRFGLGEGGREAASAEQQLRFWL